jgi:uroporphyrinogen decarboxylase
MLPRERVICALNHKEPDRIPKDLGGSIATSINAMAYQRVKEYLGLKVRKSRVRNVILFTPEVDEEIRKNWGIDTVSLDRLEAAPGIPFRGKWKQFHLPNGEPALYPEGFSPVIREDGGWELFHDGVKTNVLSTQTGSFVPVHFPLKGADLNRLEEYELPGFEDRELEYLHRRARWLFENTDYAIFGWFGGSIFEQTHYLCGYDEIMIRLITERDFVRALFEKLARQMIEDARLYLDAVGKYIQVIGFYDDFGVQNGPMIAPSLFRELIKPLLGEVYGEVHRLTDAFLFLHSCGSVYEFIEDFIEIGVDILSPVQTSAFRMEPERLKEEFGTRISFWGGGCDVHRILPLGSPEEVRRDVRRRMEIFGKGGGFVFAPIHNIQADVPPQNIEAMYDEACNFAKLE